MYHISPSLVSNSDTELELDQGFEAKQSDQAFGQNSDDHHDPGHFEQHSTMQSTENKNSSTAAVAQKAENTTAFTINLDDNELPRSLESAQRNLESPQRSLLEEAEAVVARLRPACSPYQASFPLHNNHMDGD